MILLSLMLPPVAPAYVTDQLVRPPLDYNTFRPATPSDPPFPARGDTYVDSTFNETIRRLTNQTAGPRTHGSDIYSKNGFFNATGTRMFHRSANGKLNIINVNTSAVVCADIQGVDLPADSSFDPVHANTWYFFRGTELRSFDLDTCQHTGVVKDFEVRLETLGGSVDWIDASGRYMVLNLGGQVHVWDKLENQLYARTFSFDEYATCGDGWVGISPDGKYVITAGDTRDPATCNDDPAPPGPFKPTHYSFEILHGVNPTLGDPVLFWTLTGGHADVVSASNGKTYFVATDSTVTGDIFRVDVTIPQDPITAHFEEGWNKQVADHWPPIVNLDNPDGEWLDTDGHLSGVSKGSLRDWVYVSIESLDDAFRDPSDGDRGTWRRYKQEIFMVNVLSREVRRLAHHRSRGLAGECAQYNHQPRVSASWDGGRVAWASNFNVYNLDSPTVGYSDIYAIAVPVPTVSVTAPANGATVQGNRAVFASVNAGIVAVQFKLDGANLGAEDTSAPYQVVWDTTQATPGSTHTLTAVARDAAGVLTTSSPVSVIVRTNDPPPTVSIEDPANGATVSGTYVVNATVSDDVGVVGVQFKVNGQNLGAEDREAPWARSWNTVNTADGTHTLQAVARDAAGNFTTSSAVSVVVNNDQPTVSITAPATCATVRGTNVVTATASDDVGVVGVQFKLNGQNLGAEDREAPWERTWNTVNTANGTHTLTAVVRDAAGNTRTSSPVVVTVSNP
jgi:hypothetical protein